MVDELARRGLSVNYPCVIPGEQDGIIRDTTIHRRGVVYPPGYYSPDHNPSSFNNLCRIFSMAQIYCCFKHVLPLTMGRRDIYLWFQAATAKLLYMLNIPLSAVDGWSEVSPSRTCGFQGIGPNFFAIATKMLNSSTISQGK